MADVILAALVVAPLLITLIFKSNAALSFMALCAGFVAISFASSDLKNLTGNLDFSIDASTLNLILLSVPLLFTLLLSRGFSKDKIALILHGVIALCAGGLLALVAIPLLHGSVQADFASSSWWADLQ